MIVSPICEMIGIEYPIFQGGMAWIADGKLAAAVSNGGGLGIISAMNAGGDYLREQIRIARELTDKPFGVNIMLMSPHVDEVAKIAVSYTHLHKECYHTGNIGRHQNIAVTYSERHRHCCYSGYGRTHSGSSTDSCYQRQNACYRGKIADFGQDL